MGREDRVEVTVAAAAAARVCPRLAVGWWLGCDFPARWAVCDFLRLARGGWSRRWRIPLRVHPVRLLLPDLRGLLRARIFSCVRGRRDGADVFSWRMLLDASQERARTRRPPGGGCFLRLTREHRPRGRADSAGRWLRWGVGLIGWGLGPPVEAWNLKVGCRSRREKGLWVGGGGK